MKSNLTDEFIESDLFVRATRVVLQNEFATVSLIQRHLKLGYSLALRIIDQMVDVGLIGEPRNEGGHRDVLWNSSRCSEYLKHFGSVLEPAEHKLQNILQGESMKEQPATSITDVEQDVKTAYEAFYAAWHACRVDYDERRINAEHTLQAALYFHLRNGLDPSRFVVLTELSMLLPNEEDCPATEDKAPTQMTKAVLDLVVARSADCSDGDRLEILMAVELKYLPRKYPSALSIRKDLTNLSRVWSFKRKEKRPMLDVERINDSPTGISINNKRVLIWGVFCDAVKSGSYRSEEFWKPTRVKEGSRWYSKKRPTNLVVAYCVTESGAGNSLVVFDGPLHDKYIGNNS